MKRPSELSQRAQLIAIMLISILLISVLPTPANGLLLIYWCIFGLLLVRTNSLTAALIGGLRLMPLVVALLGLLWFGLGWTLLIIAVIGIWWFWDSVSAAPRNSAPPRLGSQNVATQRIFHARALLIVPAVCLLLLLADNHHPYKVYQPNGIFSEDVQVLLLLGGAVLLVAAFPRQPRAADGRRGAKINGWLVMIILLAFGLRVWSVDSGLRWMVLDEITFMHAATNIRRLDMQLLLPMVFPATFTHIYAYLQAVSTEIFTPSFLALRFPSVVIGTLTIPALYVFVKELFVSGGRPKGAATQIALLAALLLAVFPPHIHFSRMGINNIIDPLIGLLALVALLRGIQLGHAHYFVLAGVLLGLGQYFYEGGRLLFPALIVCWMLTRVWLSPRENRYALLRNFGLLVAAALLVALPLLYTLQAYRLPLLPRAESMVNAGLSELLGATVYDAAFGSALFSRTAFARHLFSQVDMPPAHYGGETALLLVYLQPFFVVGVFLVLRGLRQAGHDALLSRSACLFLVIWLGGGLLGLSFLQPISLSARMVVLFPPILLYAALGFYAARRFFGRRVLLLLVAVICCGQVVYYFGAHLPLFNLQQRTVVDFVDVAYRARELPAGTQSFIVTVHGRSPLALNTLLDYWGSDLKIQFIRPAELNVDLFPRNIAYGFFLEAGDYYSYEVLRGAFDLGRAQLSPFNIPLERQYRLYYVPPPQTP